MKFYLLYGKKGEPVLIIKVVETETTEIETIAYKIDGIRLNEYKICLSPRELKELTKNRLTSDKEKELYNHVENQCLYMELQRQHKSYDLPIPAKNDKITNDIIEFIKTLGLTLEQKIDAKKDELDNLSKESKQITHQILNDFLKVVPVIMILSVLLVDNNLTEEILSHLSFKTQVGISAFIPASLLSAVACAIIKNANKKIDRLLPKVFIAQHYLDTYEKEEEKQEKRQGVKLRVHRLRGPISEIKVFDKSAECSMSYNEGLINDKTDPKIVNLNALPKRINLYPKRINLHTVPNAKKIEYLKFIKNELEEMKLERKYSCVSSSERMYGTCENTANMEAQISNQNSSRIPTEDKTTAPNALVRRIGAKVRYIRVEGGRQ